MHPVVRRRSAFARCSVAALAACTVLACADGSPLETGDDVGQITVDASASWTHVRLGEPAVPVAVTDPARSADWDIAFFGTAVMLNGGAAGPGGVEGHCLCQNSGATNAQVLAMTPASERAAFEAVGPGSLPTEASAWTNDALAPAITGWYSYNPVTHQVGANPARVWKVRHAETPNPGYAKLHVIAVEGATQASAGRVTIEYAVQPSASSAFGETRTAVLDATGGRVYFDFARGEVSSASDWDISLEGYTIRINGGVSGNGGAGAVLASESFAEMTTASDAPAQVYAADAFGGVFNAHRWYRYNLTGAHEVSPTFDVYLVRRGSAVWKVQITGYYSVTGDPRRITFRYERIV